MAWKQKIKEEHYKLRQLSFSKKLGYIWDYYKLLLAGIAVGTLVICVAVQIFHNSQIVTELSVALVNASGDDTAVTELREGFTEYADLGGEKQEVVVDSGYQMQPESMDQMTVASQTKIMASVSGASLDILLMPREVFEFYEAAGMFLDLREVFSAKEYENRKRQIVFGGSKEETQDKALGLQVGKSAEIKKIFGEQEVILAIPENADNTKNIQKFVQYLLS